MTAEREVIVGERTVLRPAALGDAARLLEILTAPGVAEWWHGYDLERAHHTIADPEVSTFMVEVDGAVAGLIQYWEEPDPDYRHAGVDIALDPSFWGQGLGVDAVRALARHLLDVRGHHRLTIDPAVSNKRAIRCYEKAGFRPVGVMRRYERADDGTWRDGLLMDLLAEDLI